jgi:hypothetical protein
MRGRTERFHLRSNNAASGFLNCLCSFHGSSCRLLEPAFRWPEPLRAGFGFAKTSPGRCTLDHGRDSILVPDGLSLVAYHGHNDGALTAAHVAFQMEDLLPGT